MIPLPSLAFVECAPLKHSLTAPSVTRSVDSPRRQRSAFVARAAGPEKGKEVTLSSKPIPRHPRPAIIGLFVDAIRGHSNNSALAARYGPVFHSDYLGEPVVKVTSLSAVNACVRDKRLSAIDAYPQFFIDLIGQDSMIFAEGEKHRESRARVSPAFLPPLLPRYFDNAATSARTLWDSVTPPCNLVDALSDHALRVNISGTTFARPFEDQRQFDDYIKLFEQLIAGLYSLPNSDVRKRAYAAREELLDRFGKIVAERAVLDRDVVEELLQSDMTTMTGLGSLVTEGKIDLITVLLVKDAITAQENGDSSVFRAAAADLLNMWVAGTITQIGTMITCVKEMCSDRDTWNRLRAEQDGVPELTYESLKKDMPLLRSFMTECLRLRSPLSMLPRTAVEDMDIAGFRVPKGSKVILDVTAATRDPALLERPEEIVIDRYIGRDDLATDMNILFGGTGSRHYCIGAAVAKTTVLTTLAVLIREYDTQLEPRSSYEYVTIPQVRPKDGLNLASISVRGVKNSSI